MEREELIRKFKMKFDKNIITPHIISHRVRGNTVIEFSSGTDFEHKPIYGVTVRTYKWADEWGSPDLSKPFHSRAEADNYIKKLMEVV
jgi:hypothetical protein